MSDGDMILLVPILAVVAGALLYALAANPKLSEMGRLTFGAGMLVTLWLLATNGVHIFVSR